MSVLKTDTVFYTISIAIVWEIPNQVWNDVFILKKLFTSIIESKKRGKNIFILGDYNDADDKNKNISNYKLGFTNRVRSVNSFTSHI